MVPLRGLMGHLMMKRGVRRKRMIGGLRVGGHPMGAPVEG
jgi:hypothetical protein